MAEGSVRNLRWDHGRPRAENVSGTADTPLGEPGRNEQERLDKALQEDRGAS